ncbi:MarR family transcriptional regulator, partial [Oenococcus oeni]
PTNAYILLYLFFNKNSSQSELAQKLVINKGQITRETTKLLSLNFISKEISSKNRTTNVIAISSDGKKVIKKIIDIRNQWWEEKLKLSGVKTSSEFLDSLKKLESILN